MMKDIVFSSAIVVLLVVILVMQFLMAPSGRPGSAFPPDELRKFAAKLESERLYEPAVQEYQRYLETASVPPDQHANLLYKIGTLYMDELQDYENALTAFLRLQNFFPKSAVVREAEKRMIRCYEELKRGYDAQRRLEKLTDLKPEDRPEGAIVAQVGETFFTREQIENEIARMPDYLKQHYQTPQQKLAYLNQKVMQELLYDMAQRREYQKNPEIRKQIQEYEKSLLAQQVYQEEVQNKIHITPNDIELYYKANPDEFTRPATAKIAHILVDDEEQAIAVQEKIKNGLPFAEAVQTFSLDELTRSKNGELGSIREGSPLLPGVGEEKALVKTLLQLPTGAVSGVLKSANGYHLFQIIEKQEKTVLPLEDVKQQVRQHVSQMRQQEYQQQLLDEMTQAERVKIFEPVMLSP